MTTPSRRLGLGKTIAFGLIVSTLTLILIDWVASYLVPPPPRIEAIPTSHYFRFDPILMWRPMPGYRDDLVAISGDGFRGEERIQPEAGRKLVFLLGGSTVFGLGLHNDQTIACFLQRLIDARPGGERYQVVNAGVTGYYSTQELILAQRKLIAYRPAIIISLTGRNDVFYSLEPDYRADEIPYHGQLRGALGALDPYFTPSEAREPKLHLMQLMSRTYHRVKEMDWAQEWSGSNLKFHPEAIHTFIRNERSLQALLSAHGIEYRLFLQPLLTWPPRKQSLADKSLHRPAYLDLLTTGYQQLVAEAREELKEDWFGDVLTLPDDERESIFIDNAHFSEYGSRIVARLIARAVFGDAAAPWISLEDRRSAVFLGAGWYDQENGYRWTGKRAEATIECPSGEGDGLTFRIEGNAGAVPSHLRVLFGARLVLDADLTANQEITLLRTVPAEWRGLVSQLTIETTPTWVPKNLRMNDDTRELGVLIRAFGFEGQGSKFKVGQGG